MPKLKSLLVATASFLLLAPSSALRAEDWKGTPETSSLDAGALAGLSNVQGGYGFGLMGTVAKKIVPQGFVPDLNNSVSLEFGFGPHFRSGENAGLYALHLRWDLQKDEHWLLYAVGGVHGNFSAHAYAHTFHIYPRFAAGVMLSPKLDSIVRFRAEVSHELIAVGFNIPLWF